MKKLFSVLFAFVFISLAVVPAFASQNCCCGHTPLVVVGGMNNYPLVRDEGTKNETQVWPPVIDYKKVASAAFLGLSDAALSLNRNKFADRIIPLANSLFEPAACDANGNSKYNITTKTFPLSMENYPEIVASGYKSEEGIVHTACDKLGADHVYYFNYDWRLDPMELAKALNNMIETVKAQTRHNKVDIAVCSLGGSTALAYLQEFGCNDIESCVFLSSAFSGSLAASEIFTGHVTVDKTALKQYLRINVNLKNNMDCVLDTFVDVLDETGSLGIIVMLANKFIGSLQERVFKEVLIDNLCTMPGMWSLVREDAYEQAKDTLLDKTKYAGLIKKIDSFHYNVRQKRKEIITDAMRKGMTVYFCSHYNDAMIPLYPSAVVQSDGLIETVCTSAGAVCAPLGSTLPKGYVQKNTCCGKNHLSADGIIDASTCMFPEQTWFFNNVAHVGCPYGSEYSEFVFWLLSSQTQQTVWSNPLYPQFMTSEDRGATIHPLI